MEHQSILFWGRLLNNFWECDKMTELGEKLLRQLISEIIKKSGDKYVLYTKHKGKNGKRRRLGTHPSKEAAERQERAIQRSKHGN